MEDLMNYNMQEGLQSPNHADVTTETDLRSITMNPLESLWKTEQTAVSMRD